MLNEPRATRIECILHGTEFFAVCPTCNPRPMTTTPDPLAALHIHRWFEYGSRPVKCRDCGKPTSATLSQARAALASEGGLDDWRLGEVLRTNAPSTNKPWWLMSGDDWDEYASRVRMAFGTARLATPTEEPA
jgi:hypothetical protein